MVDSSCVLALPTSLVLLLHLHILSYPQCNSPEYSPEKLFARNRPLRERTKTMEDIVAFLVEKIEGQERCKSILGGTYPCLQPSDTVTFRIHVAKYLETLRNAVIRPNNQVSTKARIPTGKALQTGSLSSKAKSFAKTSKLGAARNNTVSLPHTNSLQVAWWWSAIVVRKSLLEECCGDRFEKLLLGLSTHALFAQVPTSSDLHPLDAAIPNLTKSLQDQSQEYASLLSRTMGLFAERVQSVSNLNTRARELMSLRSRLESMHQDEIEGLSTRRLLEIRDSKRREFMDAWETDHHPGSPVADGEQSMTASDALRWISSFVGISTANIQREVPTSSVETAPSALLNLETTTVQTLPTASAHHPAMMHKLRSLPSLVPPHLDSPDGKVTDPSPTLPCLQELLDVASAQKTALEVALEAAIKARKNTSQRLNESVEIATAVQAPDTNTEESNQLDLQATVAESSLRAKTSPTRAPSNTRGSGFISGSLAMSDEPHTQQQIESSALNVRESPEPHVTPPSILPNTDLSSQEPPQLTPLFTEQPSGEPPLPSDVPPSRNSWSLISSPPASDANRSLCQEPPALTAQFSSQLLLATEMSTPGSPRPPISNWGEDRLHQEDSPSITTELSSQLPVVMEATTPSSSRPLSILVMDRLYHEELSQQEILLVSTKELSNHLPSVTEFSTHDNSQVPIALPSISGADDSYFKELQQREPSLALTKELLEPSLVMEVSTRSDSLPPIASPSILGADNSYSEELSQQRIALAITKQPSSQLPLVTAESVHGPSASPSTLDINSFCSKNLPQQLTPLATTKQHSGRPPSTPEMSTPNNSTLQPAVTISPMMSLVLRPYETSTPAPNRRSNHRDEQATRSPGSDGDVALFTRDSHLDVSAVRTNTMTSHPQLMIADMSLPDVSVNDIEFDTVLSREFDILKREQRHEPVAELDQTEIPYEGHSIILRDILLRAGKEDSFHLIDGLQDVDEGMGDETIVWG